MADPFATVKQDLETAVREADTLYERWERIKDSADPGAIEDRKRKVNKKIGNIQNDLDDLSVSIQQTLENRSSFRHISDDEIAERKRFVSTIQGKLNRYKAAVNDQANRAKVQKAQKEALIGEVRGPGKGKDRYQSIPDEPTADANEDFFGDQLAQQKRAEAEQDDMLDDVALGVGRLKDMAGNIHTELKEQDEMLNDLDSGMAHLKDKLDNAKNKLDKVISESSEKGRMGCIAILVILLVAVMVLFFNT